MPDLQLINTATVAGTYGVDAEAAPLTVTSTVATATIITGLTAEKTADKKYWIDGNLKYTVHIVNNADHDFETPTFKDILNKDIITLVENSVQADDVDIVYTHNTDTGELSIDLPTIAAGGEKTITFQVSKV